MLRGFNFSIGEYYHLYSRGTDKRKIFLNKRDYDRFLILLYICNNIETLHLSDQKGKPFDDFFGIQKKDTLIDIGAYCLMPNHFHLLVREKKDGGISAFMKKLLTAYVMYFNKRYERKGALFENRFKARHLDTDRDLKYQFAYCHLNPVKLFDQHWRERRTYNDPQTFAFLDTYQYSSYNDYQDTERIQKNILSKESFPGYFEDEDFKSFLSEWLNYNKLSRTVLDN